MICIQTANVSLKEKACWAASTLGEIAKTAKERLHTCKRARHAQTLAAVHLQDNVLTVTKRAFLPSSRYPCSAALLMGCPPPPPHTQTYRDIHTHTHTDRDIQTQVALSFDAEVQTWWVQCLGSIQHKVLHHTCSLKVQGLVEGRWQRHAARMTGSSRKAPFAFRRLLLLGQCRGHCQCHVAEHVDVGGGILQGGIFSVLQGAQDLLDHRQH